MIIAEIPKANYCSFFCFLLTMDECIINVWGYTEILPNLNFPTATCRAVNPPRLQISNQNLVESNRIPIVRLGSVIDHNRTYILL